MDVPVTLDLTHEEREALAKRVTAIKLCGLLSHREAERAVYDDVLRVREAKKLLKESGRQRNTANGRVR